jgi:RND superfamily putative drug exporter
MTATIARWSLAHRRLVVSGWLVLTVVGIASVGSATKAISAQFSVPGREAWQTNAQILRTGGNGGNDAPLVPVVTRPSGTSVESAAVRTGCQWPPRRARA